MPSKCGALTGLWVLHTSRIGARCLVFRRLTEPKLQNPTPSVLFLTRLPSHRGLGGPLFVTGGCWDECWDVLQGERLETPSAYRVSSNRSLIPSQGSPIF